MRLIDADALEELFREVIGNIAKKQVMNGNLEHMVRASAMTIEMIKDASTIEPTQKMGKWMQTETMNIYECSCCHSRWNVYYVCDFDYCPHCGAKMEVE